MLTKRAFCTGLMLVAVAAQVPSVAAHDSEKGPNGGPMVEVKGLHLELVTKEMDVAVVLSDASHAPLASTGATGRLVILEGSSQKTVTLAPAQPDRLTAKLEKPLAKGTRVVVSAKLASGLDLLARFVAK